MFDPAIIITVYTFSIRPHKNWHVIVGRQYELIVEVFDATSNRIHPSDNIVMQMDIPTEYFAVRDTVKVVATLHVLTCDYSFFYPLQSLQNGTWALGSPLKVGSAEIRATLLGVKDARDKLVPLDTPLVANGQMEIFDRIELDPEIAGRGCPFIADQVVSGTYMNLTLSTAVFPWDPISRPSYHLKYSLAQKGRAAGSFLWSSSNQTVSTVTQNGIAATRNAVGETAITAAMSKASHNYGKATVLVLPASGQSSYPAFAIKKSAILTLPSLLQVSTF